MKCLAVRSSKESLGSAFKMSSKHLRVTSASRTANDGTIETLSFRKGVNVLVGEPNTGKTRWLETIDFLLGDDGKAEEKLGEVIFDKYVSAKVVLAIDDDEMVAERRWQEQGAKTKIFVNDAPYDVAGFRQLLLDRLDIPS